MLVVKLGVRGGVCLMGASVSDGVMVFCGGLAIWGDLKPDTS